MAKYADILFSGSAENLAQRKIPVGSPTNKHPCLPLLYDTGRVHGNHVCIEKRTADAPQESEQVPGTVCPNRKNIPHISKKMEPLSTSARNRMEESDVVCHRHSISIDTPYNIYWVLIIPVTYSIVASVAFYIEKRPDNDCMDNDLKCRYIKMKEEATPNEMAELGNILELNRDNAGIEIVREDVEAYEDAVREQATLAEQAHPEKQAAKELENKTTSFKSKSIGNKSKK